MFNIYYLLLCETLTPEVEGSLGTEGKGASTGSSEIATPWSGLGGVCGNCWAGSSGCALATAGFGTSRPCKSIFTSSTLALFLNL